MDSDLSFELLVKTTDDDHPNLSADSWVKLLPDEIRSDADGIAENGGLRFFIGDTEFSFVDEMPGIQINVDGPLGMPSAISILNTIIASIEVEVGVKLKTVWLKRQPPE